MRAISYAACILILRPVVTGLLRHPSGQTLDMFGGVPDAPLLRILVVKLWMSVPIRSAIALFDPLRFWPLLSVSGDPQGAFLGALVPAGLVEAGRGADTAEADTAEAGTGLCRDCLRLAEFHCRGDTIGAGVARLIRKPLP